MEDGLDPGYGKAVGAEDFVEVFFFSEVGIREGTDCADAEIIMGRGAGDCEDCCWDSVHCVEVESFGI